METDEFDPILDLGEVAETLGISHLATVHMYEMSVMNETLIIEDLRKGLLFEWLTFINLNLRDHPHDFEQAIMKLFFDELGDPMSIDITNEEFERMLDDKSYAGSIKVINFDHNNNEVDSIMFRLTLTQYINLLEIGALS
ncbi:MAG: hypothetical protein RIT30_245 [Bacteroidota bacterium]|jgi:transposase